MKSNRPLFVTVKVPSAVNFKIVYDTPSIVAVVDELPPVAVP
jgi:hypothetical protein